jgi:hypothetical protein
MYKQQIGIVILVHRAIKQYLKEIMISILHKLTNQNIILLMGCLNRIDNLSNQLERIKKYLFKIQKSSLTYNFSMKTLKKKYWTFNSYRFIIEIQFGIKVEVPQEKKI